MYTEGFEQFIKASKTVPYQEWHKAIAELYRHSLQQHCEILSENLALMSEQFKRFSQAKNPEDLLGLQRNFLSEDLNATMKTVQKAMHNSMENMEEFTKLCGTTIREQEHQQPLAGVRPEKEREKERSK